ncbi:MAG: tRNA (guanine(10)-N(2))-dimethyltransferase [Candidatus Nanohalarchaeota archaeon]|nr:MAG: tRNA (guanine(10)-N(2))-dimethyltransferase [Candidatus Nanohaloarchaeota archaeon]
MDAENTKIVCEGKANVHVYEGKITKKDPVFFNPEMKFNRDISVACVKVAWEMSSEAWVICDLLSGCGIRGIRYLLEVPGIEFAVLNDANPTAFEIIKRNVGLNKVEGAEIENMESNVLLSMHGNKFNFVDIDPFGSPVPFLDNAARAVRHGGFLGVTATDLGPLAGTYPKTCLRRYGAKSLKTDVMHETGVRILVGYIIRVLSSYDKGFLPLLCFCSRHYYRIFGKVKRSRSCADKAVAGLGYMLYCHKCGKRKYSRFNKETCACGAEFDYAGPLYTGGLFDDEFVESIEPMDSKMEKFVDILREESKVDGMLYDVHEICSLNKLETVRRDCLVSCLREKDYSASGSVFGGHTVRTDAPLSVIVECVREK